MGITPSKLPPRDVLLNLQNATSSPLLSASPSGSGSGSGSRSRSSNSFQNGSPDADFEFLIDHNLSFNEMNIILTPAQIRAIRDTNLQSFLSIIRFITFRLIQLASLKNVPLFEFPLNKLLNSIRVLVLLLPYLYESQDLQYTEKLIFWSMENAYDKDSLNLDNASMVTSIGASLSPSDDDTNTSGSSSKTNHSNDSTKPQVDYKTTQNTVDNSSLKPNFNKSNHNSTVLGHKLVLILVDLLFTSGFTVPIHNTISRKPSFKPITANLLDFVIWEPGVGSLNNNNDEKDYELNYNDPKLDLDSNRFEILRLLITLCSQCLFKTTNNLVPMGSRFLTVLVTSLPKLQTLTLISSLINTTCRSTSVIQHSPKGIDSITNPTLKKMRVLFCTNAIQLFSLLIVYPLPKSDLEFLKKLNILDENVNPGSVNIFRFYCGKLHKEKELLFLERGLVNPLFEVFNLYGNTDNSSQSQDSQQQQQGQQSQQQGQNQFSNLKSKFLGENLNPSVWTLEMVIIFWEFYQCNKKFRSFISTRKGPKLMVVLLYYIHNLRNNENYRNLVRLMSYLILYLSHDPIISKLLVTPISYKFINSIPSSFRTSTTENPITYRDFLLIQSSNMILAETPFVLIPTIIEWVYNLVPLTPPTQVSPSVSQPTTPVLSHRKQSSISILGADHDALSQTTSSSVVQLVLRFSTMSVTANGKTQINLNLDLLSLLLRSIVHAILRTPEKYHYYLVYMIFKHQNIFTTVSKHLHKISNDLIALQESEAADLEAELEFENSGYASPNRESLSLGSPQLRPSISRHPSQVSQLSQNGGGGNNNNFNNNSTVQPQMIPPPANQQQQRHMSQTSLHSTISRTSMDSHNEENNTNSFLDSITEGVESTNLIRPKLPTGMSEKFKGKQPLHAPLEKTWSGLNALNIILHLIDYICLNVTAAVISSKDTSIMINKIRGLDYKDFIMSCKTNEIPVPKDFLPVNISLNSLSLQGSNFEPLKFQWSNLSLGWYESVLWGSIYVNFDSPKVYNTNNSSGSHNGVTLLDIANPLQAFKKVGQDWGFNWTGSNNSANNNNSTNANGNGNAANETPVVGVKRLQLTSEEDYIGIINNAAITFSIWNNSRIKLFKINPKSNMPNTTRDFTDNLIKRLGSISFKRNSIDQYAPSTPVLQSPTQSQGQFSQPGTPVSSGINLFKNQNPFSAKKSTHVESPILGYFPPLDISNEDDFDSLYGIGTGGTPGTPRNDGYESSRNSLSIQRTYSRNSNVNNTTYSSKANTPKNGTPVLGPQ